MAAKVRSAVASVDFDTFHKTSARCIRKAIFGLDEHGHIAKHYEMPKNNLLITNVDIQSVEPVDSQTKASLQKTVTQAIEITTKRQESAARNQAAKLEQEAVGELAKQRIDDQSKAEEAKTKLVELEANCKTVENQGKAIAEAKAKAQADAIKAEANLKCAELKARAKAIENEAQLEKISKKQDVVFQHEKSVTDIEIQKANEMAKIESNKFDKMVAAIGSDTIVAMASAGPEF